MNNESISNDTNSLSEDDSKNKKFDLNLKTLNPEKDLLHFIKCQNFKLTSNNEIKHPNVSKNSS